MAPAAALGLRHKVAVLGTAAAVTLLVLSWSYLTCIGAATYACLYWQRPELHFVSQEPEVRPPAGAGHAVQQGKRGPGSEAASARRGPAVLAPQATELIASGSLNDGGEGLRLRSISSSDGGSRDGGGGGRSSPDRLPVPKIIHQTWKTTEIPEEWAAARQSCLDLHPDYQYRLWTDADALRFIEDGYPWFLPTFLSYPYAIQRVDAVRYFILYHFGGIYLDLDVGCYRRLDFMRSANFTAPLTYPIGISNDVMAAAPGAAFLEVATRNLRRWNKWMLMKYVQVMFSTGPMFLTVQYSLFPHKADVAMVPATLYGKYNSSGDPALFHLHGSSWHAGDAPLVFWLDRHKVALLAAAAAAAAAALGWAWLQCALPGLQVLRAGYKPAD